MMKQLIVNMIYWFCKFIQADKKEILNIANLFPNWIQRGIKAKFEFKTRWSAWRVLQ